MATILATTKLKKKNPTLKNESYKGANTKEVGGL